VSFRAHIGHGIDGECVRAVFGSSVVRNIGFFSLGLNKSGAVAREDISPQPAG
jgi:hypothetical protein